MSRDRTAGPVVFGGRAEGPAYPGGSARRTRTPLRIVSKSALPLFVYGTLGRGRANEHLLARIGGSWAAATVRGRLIDRGWGAAAGFPALVLDEDTDPVRGHLFVSPALADHWDELDAFEGEEYRRVRTTALREDGSPVEAFVYAASDEAPPGRDER